MTDQDPNPDETPASGPSGSDPYWSTQHPIPADSTRPIPPYEHLAPPAATTPVGRARGLSAAVLAGALVLGGAAGVGGAAAYDTWHSDSPAPATSGTSTAGSITASNAASLPSGSVEQVAAKVLPAVVKINVTGLQEAGSGSGIVLNKDGQILTNNHVVDVAGDNGRITVNFNDGSTLKASVVGTDPVTDLAVIQVDGAKNLTPANIGRSGDLLVGQQVVAVGSPYGLNATVTSGIVSALNRPVSVSSQPEQPPQQSDPFGFEQQLPQQQSPAQNLSTTYPAIQTDAAINPGNSGGPLVNMDGQVVGINSSIRTSDSGGLSSSSGGSIGLGFAIPIDEVLPIVNQLVAGETPTHARMAITVSDVTARTVAQGAQIRSVENNGPANRAGLKKGDVITKVDDQVIDGADSLVATVRGHRPGDTIKVTYLRAGRTHTTTATLGSDANTTKS